MPNPDATPQADYAAAVESLAGRVLSALRSERDALVLSDHVEQSVDAKAALAAIRVLGPDVFAPALLAGAPFGPGDREAVAMAFRIFPPAPGDPPQVVRRDRAASELLARHGGDPLRLPPPAPVADGGLPWPALAGRMAGLSPLALPGVDAESAELACREVRALSMGVVRAMLRRDHPTAARLARWTALARHQGAAARPELDLPAVLAHLDLCGAGTARTALDTAVARHLLTGRPA